MEDARMIATCLGNDPGALEKMLQQPRAPNCRDVVGRTPLHCAALAGHAEPAKLLLEAGVAEDARCDIEGSTALLLAVPRPRGYCQLVH